MIQLNRQHWTLAFVLALLVHVSVYLYSIDLPGGVPVYRGGGTFDQGDSQSSSAAGVFVQLGKAGQSAGEKPTSAALQEKAPDVKTRESLAQGVVAGEDQPGPAAEKNVPEKTPEPRTEQVTEKTVSPSSTKVGPAAKEPAAEPKTESKIVAAPLPKRKPKRPTLQPELESLGRRLSVQGPTPNTRSTAPAKPSKPSKPSKPTGPKKGPNDSAAKPASDTKTAKKLDFFNSGGRKGTASGNRSGEIRELNYEDRVLLWLKRHGSYPYGAAIFQLEDTVTLKFAISRSGEILYYELIKKSEYDLLNRAVERMMDRSSPVPPIPPEISKNEIVYTVPVHFSLSKR